MEPVLYIFLILVACGVLIKAVNAFIESSTIIAHHLNISTYTISFLIISIATSLPELVVGINSGLSGNPILAYGAVIGSNIALLTLVIAIPVLLGETLSTNTILYNKDAYLGALFTIMPLAMSIDGKLTRIDGLLLLSGYVIYFIAVLKRGSFFENLIEKFEHRNMWKQGTLFVGSLLVVLAASEVIVESALNLSTLVALELGFIGLSITALGTSLPEIAYTVSASKRIHKDSALGDIIGSVIANSTAVLGTVAVIKPIIITNATVGLSSLTFLLFTILLFLRFVKTKETLDKKEALLLFVIYIAFIIFEYQMQLK
ncbi:MAG: sodium:calcium antiporter [Patescibacteria group bacterium]